jgi:hypothetical protein
MDDLIGRLQTRAADPKRRTDAPQSISTAGPGGTLTTMFGNTGQLGGLNLGSVMSDLQRVVAANQEGRAIDADIAGRVEAVTAGMSTDNSTGLPAPASTAALDGAETSLGFALPAELRRLYAEVADGGFGPGGGLLPIDRAVGVYRDLRANPPLPRGRTWPERLLPLVDRDPGYDALEVGTGRVVGWDPEGLAEYAGPKAWLRSFSELSPSLEAWLGEWVDARPAHEVLQERVNATLIEDARRSRALMAAKTPAERRAMGLPVVGWERVVWGGLGLEDDELSG